jgi:hypothetical protein
MLNFVPGIGRKDSSTRNNSPKHLHLNPTDMKRGRTMMILPLYQFHTEGKKGEINRCYRPMISETLTAPLS